MSKDFIIGIDIGGTCTDCVVLDNNGGATRVRAPKALGLPYNRVDA